MAKPFKVIMEKWLSEMKRPHWEVPDEPGSKPIPKDHVRLYHQTRKSTLSRLRHSGIEPRQPVEGPRGIYADEKGFYGKPDTIPTAEFHVHKDDFKHPPFVTRDRVEPDKIIATHKDWHETVRYIDRDPRGLKKSILDGEHDHLMNDGSKYSKAIRFIKKREAANKK